MAALNQRSLQPGERIRVLIVDDSVVIRRLVAHALEEDSAIEVVGAAANGAIALQRIPQFNPDVLTLDIEMPEMDGLETLRRVRRQYPATARHHVQHPHRARRGRDSGRSAPRGRRLRGQGFQRRIARSLHGAPAAGTGPEDQTVLPPARTKQRRDPAGSVTGTEGHADLAEHEGAPQSSRDRRLHGRAHRVGHDLTPTACRIPAAGPGGTAHAASFHPVARGASSFDLPVVSRGSHPGRIGGCGQDPDRPRRLSSQGCIQRQRRRARLSGSVRAAELLPSLRRCAVCFCRRGLWRRGRRRDSHRDGAGRIARRGDSQSPGGQCPRAG